MDLDLKGRVAIVTGASKGIGRAVAASLAGEGVNIVICARGRDALLKTEEEIKGAGGSVIAIQADATRPEAVKKVVDATLKKFGRLDILVNNVGGVSRFGSFLDLTDDDWQNAFDLNVKSMIYFVRHCLPFLRKSGSPRIINISSLSGVQPGSYNPHYTAVKAAAINLSKYLANLFAGDNILVNCICAGPVETYLWDKNIEHVAAARGVSGDEARTMVGNEEASKIPLKKVGSPEDVAGIAVYLASDRARWITGSCLHVDGGKLRTIC